MKCIHASIRFDLFIEFSLCYPRFQIIIEMMKENILGSIQFVKTFRVSEKKSVRKVFSRTKQTLEIDYFRLTNFITH